MPVLGCHRRRELTSEERYRSAETLFLHGRLDAAFAEAESGLHSADDPTWAARFRIQAAQTRLFQGQSADVLRILRPASNPTADPDLTVRRFTLLSLAYAQQSDPEKESEALDAGRHISGVSPSAAAELLAARARLALERNQLDVAEALFQQSRVTAGAGKNSFAEASALLNLSVIHLQRAQYNEAIEESNKAASVASSIDAQVLVEKALGNSGWGYYQTGDYPRALANFNSASTEAAQLASTLDEETWEDNAGLCEARMEHANKAQKRYQQALHLAASLGSAVELAHVNQSIASLLLHTGRPQDARPYIVTAVELARRTRDPSDIQFGDLLQARDLALTGDRRQAIPLLLAVNRRSLTFPATHLEAQHTLADLYAEDNNAAQADTWYRRSIATYRAQRTALTSDDTRLPFFANGRDLYMDYVAFLVRNHRTADALAVVDQGRAETLSEGLDLAAAGPHPDPRPRPVPLEQLAHRAHADILVYALSPQGSYLWAANGHQSGFYTLPERSKILAAIESHRRAILAARDILREQEPAAHQLYDMLVAPAAPLIHRGDRVFIVADDGMHGLNFETLLTPAPDSHFWIEDVTITNLSSARPLDHRPPAKDNRLLVIGSPVYTGTQFTPLPNAAAEVSGVAQHFPAADRTELIGAAATPAAYLASDPARYAYIHFVSHAVASELVPLDSAVILSPPASRSGADDTSRLYAREILSHPLDADLVTISACQGSGVRAYAGEGLIGLAWAFLRAGAHRVIGALWDVSDASTPDLMQHLYDGIAAHQPPDVSLRNAKLQMLHRTGIFRKPIYWSAFQLYAAGS